MGRRGRERTSDPESSGETSDALDEARPPAGTGSGSGPQTDTRWLWLFGALIAWLIPMGWLAQPTSSSPAGKRLLVLAETPSVSELSADSAALRYYAGQGVSGILVRASTLGSLAGGGDVALATGAEILRLFRMEGIVNIYMWEQIRGRPVRADATYVFTNDLALHENILAAARRELGEEAARPYRDGEHDFGGGIPSNYIVELLAPIETARGIGVGVEGAVRQRFLDAGIEPAVEVATAADVAALPEPLPLLVVTGAGAAEALWRDRRPERLLLAPGIRNPGWPHAVLADRPRGETFSVQGGAVVVPLAEIGTTVERLRSQGYEIQGASAGGGRVDSGMPWRAAGTARIVLAAAMAASLLWLLGLPLATREGGILFAGALLAGAVSSNAGVEAAGHILPVLAVLGAASFARRRPSRERLLHGLLIAISLLVASLWLAVGRPAPDPWTVSLLALASVAVLSSSSGEPVAGNANSAIATPYLIAAIAVTASRVLPPSLPLIAVPLFASLFIPRRFLVTSAARATLLVVAPAALAAAADPALPFAVRAGLVLLALPALHR